LRSQDVITAELRRNRAPTLLASLAARNTKAVYGARLRLERLFLPVFGQTRVIHLTRTKLEAWRDGLVPRTEDVERRRRAQDTANRVLSMVKAMLNHAAADPANGIENDSAWRLVRPFKGVGRPREAHFDTPEVERLLEAIDDRYFRDLVIAGYLTGARYGELAACRVRNLDVEGETLHIPNGKTGRRTVILSPGGAAFLARVSADRPADAPLLPRSDGTAWCASHQIRPMKVALRRAGLDPEATFYALRHSHISRSIEGGVPLNVIAENCGTSVRMIETTYAKILATKRREFIARGAPSLALRASADAVDSRRDLKLGHALGT
jgi:integrase